jgi:methylated-DNA-protein-cysteine methyltransferase-like protein
MTFPKKVIRLTSAIPPGRVLNYGQIAILLENPRAARAVGYALQALPFGTDVPWHRVVGKAGAKGKISLRAFKYSEDEQYRRLAAEGILFDAEGFFPLADYLWQPSPPEVQAILES